MRAKYIFIPLVALTLLSVYAGYSKVQQSKFSSECWITAQCEDALQTRANMLWPLMGHVLKVGMSLEKTEALLGLPEEEQGTSCITELGEPQLTRTYRIPHENSADTLLTLEFSHKMKLIDFYIKGRVAPWIF